MEEKHFRKRLRNSSDFTYTLHILYIKTIDFARVIVYNIDRKREKERNKAMTYKMMEERVKEMTVEELENSKFLTEMVDRWTNDDYEWYNLVTRELKNRAR